MRVLESKESSGIVSSLRRWIQEEEGTMGRSSATRSSRRCVVSLGLDTGL